jgi:hypothetical protein
VGCLAFSRARSTMARAGGDSRMPQLKIQGPSGKGRMASISQASAASFSVLGRNIKKPRGVAEFEPRFDPASASL